MNGKRVLIGELLSELEVTTKTTMSMECILHSAVTRMITKDIRI